jgi:hypothetical protein
MPRPTSRGYALLALAAATYAAARVVGTWELYLDEASGSREASLRNDPSPVTNPS